MTVVLSLGYRRFPVRRLIVPPYAGKEPVAAPFAPKSNPGSWNFTTPRSVRLRNSEKAHVPRSTSAIAATSQLPSPSRAVTTNKNIVLPIVKPEAPNSGAVASPKSAPKAAH